MGTYFNPDNESFKKTTRNRIYVDKTGLLKHLNDVLGTEENCISVSHARRFGKSQAAAMIDAYYSLGSDSKELFSPYEIAENKEFLTHLNKYNVIHIDVSSVTDFHKDDLVAEIIKRFKDDFKEEYASIVAENESINLMIYRIYKKSGIPFIIILDEWDCVVRNFADRQDLVHEYLQFLHSLFKSEESKRFLALAYITGILPIKKIKDESALNNFREYTMLNSRQLTKYYGFTEEEVEKLCMQYDMDLDSVKTWYDGYLINGMHMYNPNSVYRAMVDHDLDSYWKNTSAFDTINQYITLNFDGLKEDILTMLEGGKVSVNVDTFQNDLSIIKTKDQALTALIHLGYLAYDNLRKKAYVPNYEVSLAYQAALSTGAWDEIAKTISKSEELLWATIDGEEEKVAKLIELSHDAYASVIKYNDENSLSCTITMAYFTAPAHYMIVREFPSGKGYADFAFIPRNKGENLPAMIVELKWDQSADTAIRQIKDRKYAGLLAEYHEDILLVGISYNKDSTDKEHECQIECVRME